MIYLHVTKKLFEKLPVDHAGRFMPTERSAWLYEKTALDINPLSGWHGNLVIFQRYNCVLLAHDATRFPLMLPALKKTDFAELNDRFVDAFLN